MKVDYLLDEIPIHNVQRIAKIVGPYSAAARALEWAHNSKEQCYFFRTRSGVLVAATDSLLQEVGALKNVELEKHFEAIKESQYVMCLHCGKVRILNQGLAKLSHLARCTRSRTRRNCAPSEPAQEPEK